MAGDRCGVRVVVGRRGGGRVGREEGDQASFASFLICLSLLVVAGALQSGAGVPSALSSILDLTQLFGSHLPHIAHSSPTRSGCEGDEEGQRRKIWWSESKVGGCAPRRWSTARTSEALVGDGVLLVLGLAPHLDVLVLAPDADALRVRARGLRGKAESVIGSDRTCKVRTHLLVVALVADLDALLHRLAVVAEQEALGEVPVRGVFGAAPGADVAVASLREEER